MDTFESLHPDPDKQGATVSRDRYDAMKVALLAVVPHSPDGIRYSELKHRVVAHLPNGEVPRGGSAAWWVTTVKLDLEARGLLERISTRGPQRIRRV